MPVFIVVIAVGTVRAPADEKVEVAEPPKYALANTDRFVDDAAEGKMTSVGSESVGVVPPEDVI